MKVVLFSHEFPPCLGGVGTIARQFFDYFNKSEDYDIEVVTSSRSCNLIESNVVCSKLFPRLWFISYYFEFSRLLKKADIIICNDPAAIYTAGRYFSDDLLAKTVCLIHGEEKYLEKGSTFASIIGFRKAFLRALYNVPRTFFVSNFIKEHYQNCHDVDVSKTHHRLLNPGAYSQEYFISSDIQRKQNRFITVGRIHPKKGFEHMLSVFEVLYMRGIDFEWVIAGGGEFFNDLNSLVKKRPIASYIKLLGPQDRSLLPSLYGQSEYCILLSEFNESYGLSYLEAAHFGAKPIGYNRCGVKDVFSHIQNGLLLNDFRDIASNAEQVINFISESAGIVAISKRSSSDFVEEFEQELLELIAENCK